jgi:heme-degrading monooxygenase HmoA
VIVHLAIHSPKPEHTGDVIASMHRFAEAASGQPGLRSVHSLRDSETGKLVGLAIWESREAFEQGVRAMRAAVEDDPFDEWEVSDPEVYLLEEV